MEMIYAPETSSGQDRTGQWWSEKGRRVTPDATVSHIRQKFDPTIFTLPYMPQFDPEAPARETMTQLRRDHAQHVQDTQRKEVLRRYHEHDSRVSGKNNDDGGGSRDSVDETKMTTGDMGNVASETSDDGVTPSNTIMMVTTPLHIAARKNSVKEIRLWIQSYSKNSLDQRDFTPLMVAALHDAVDALVFLLRLGVRKDDVDAKMKRTALHWAVARGHVRAMATLLKYGADPRFRDRDGRTPVHIAAIHASKRCLETILKFVKHEALREGDDEQMTPVHLAVISDNVKHVYLMSRLRPAIAMDLGDVEGKTALHWFAQNAQPQMDAPTLFHASKTCGQLLIEHQPQLMAMCDIEGRTALHIACSASNVALIVDICSQFEFGSNTLKALVNTQDLMGRTAVHYAAMVGHAYIIRVLRHYGADDGIVDKEGATGLHYACAKNHAQCVSVLISDNRLRHTYIRDGQGRAPIMWAVTKGNSEALRILLEAGVNASEIDDRHTTALHICALGGHTHCASLLLDHGASVDVRNAQRRSPLFIAVQYGHGETANIFIQNGANVNLLDPESRGPLHWAALCGHLSIVSLLISCAASVDLMDIEGKTPLHCAAYNGNSEVVSFLAKNGAKINHKDHEGVTALHWASCGNHIECVKILLQLKANANMLDDDMLTPYDYARAVKGDACVEMLMVSGGRSGEIVADVFANRIQRAWRRYRKRRNVRLSYRDGGRKWSIGQYASSSASSSAGAGAISRNHSADKVRSNATLNGPRSSITARKKLDLPPSFGGGRRVSIATTSGMSAGINPHERRRASVAIFSQNPREMKLPGSGDPMSANNTDMVGTVLGSSKGSRSSQSRSLFPSRPSLIKGSMSRSRVHINVATPTQTVSRYEQRMLSETVEETDEANILRSNHMLSSMSSFEFEYFRAEAMRRKREDSEM